MSSPKRRTANTYAVTMFVGRLVYRTIRRLTDLTDYMVYQRTSSTIDDYSQR